jgi:hypothetical protein
MHDLPWHGVDEGFDQSGFHAGGGTKIGLKMKEQAQVGEDFVHNLGEIPGYGPITWAHEGGAIAQSPLDFATHDWGVEVKTLGYDAIHHRFVPGREHEKIEKNKMALARGHKGVLGLLVLLNYRNGLADLYGRAFPAHPTDFRKGVGTFRSFNSEHLLARHPFANPLTDPSNPLPIVKKDDIPF